MYVCLTASRNSGVKKGGKIVPELSPILVPVDSNIVFFMDGTRTKMRYPNGDIEVLEENLREVAKLISNNGGGILISNQDNIKRFFPDPIEEGI